MSDERIIAGQYKIISKIGHGGLGTVFKVFDLELKEHLALKVFSKQISQNAEMIDRFREKIKLTRKIVHPGLATIHAFNSFKGRYFLVMEFLDGQNLEEVVQENPLDYSRACEVMIQCALVLKSTHHHGLIHGNLKPRNLVLVGDMVKIIDFGFAKPDDIQMFPGAFDIEFMAPEQLYPVEELPFIDQYALGVLFFYMLTGKVPFVVKTITDVPRYQLTIPSVRKHGSELPRRADQIISRLLRYEPKERYPSMTELLKELSLPINYCGLCNGELDVNGRCPQCKDEMEHSSPSFSPSHGEGSANATTHLNTKREKANNKAKSLKKFKRALLQNIESDYSNRCFFCAQPLPDEFPYCTRCFQPFPLLPRDEPITLFVREFDTQKQRTDTLHWLETMNVSTTNSLLPLVEKKSGFLLHLVDLPELATTFSQQLSRKGAVIETIQTGDTIQLFRLNSWWIPSLGFLVTLIMLYRGMNFTSIIPFIIALWGIHRNLKKIHKPSFHIELGRLEGILGKAVEEKSIETATAIQHNELLLQVYENILFKAYELLKTMNKEPHARKLFEDAIDAVKGIILEAAQTVIRLQELEKNCGVDTAESLYFELKALNSPQELGQSTLSSGAKKARKRQLLQQLELYKQQSKQVMKNYENLLDITNKLDQMKIDVAQLCKDLNAKPGRQALPEKAGEKLTQAMQELAAVHKALNDN